MPKSIAIDGPAGAGKSALGKSLAEKFNYIYVNTGALYRTIGFYVLQKYDAYDEEDVKVALKEIKLEQQLIDGQTQIYLNKEDVSNAIGSEKVSMAASYVSGFKSVRDFLLDLQRHTAKCHDVVMDGRDIGTVVLPNADFKLFLTASCEIRAERRMLQLKHKGQIVDYNEILQKIQERDYNDMNRPIAPLKMAKGAVLFDNSEKTFAETVEEVYKLVKWA
ncbi:MAG: (d)CMP kinase [Oscillospiraceae bacterium]|nr:(d)CMP kinase [Oscillospiraceae bacterium]